MLKIKLFRGFVVVVVLFSILSAVFGVRTINRHVIDEAQTRVRLDLNSAWSVYNSKLGEIETILQMTGGKQRLVDAMSAGNWDDPELQSRLERIRIRSGLDFLSVVSRDGKVVMRTWPPHRTGDYRVSDPAVSSALQGEPKTCMALLTASELTQEGTGLAEQAYMELDNTPYARRTNKRELTRGMVIEGAFPVQEGAQVLGAVYGGVLINRNFELIDRIRDVVYKDEEYRGVPMGTATIFLHDSRIATTVLRRNGNRALGTRVSKEVADRVLDNGLPWIGEAFVVNDRYITAYEPIRDGWNQIIGILYVGILKQPFEDTARGVAMRFVFVTLFVLVVSLVLAFIIAGRLAQPIHRLVEASNRMSGGDRPPPVETDNACHETEALIVAFNQMTDTLAEREERLRALNRSYMETLGFVSHELKSPVASIINYVYLLKEQKLGPVNERQGKALRAIDSGSQRLVEMVRHYLNLSRIENRELEPVPSRVPLLDEVLQPILDSDEAAAAEKNMTIVNNIERDVILHTDLNMTREVFENLVSNAIKYGREGGEIRVDAERANGFVEFSVWNQGEGIPPDRVDTLFEKFNRIEGSKAARQKGTGLGLFITKHIVEAHGGTIEAESEYGKWARFTFRLPAFDEEGGEDNG